MSGGIPENGRVYLKAMLKAGALEGQIYVATDGESGNFRAIALLFPPGRRMFHRYYAGLCERHTTDIALQ